MVDKGMLDQSELEKVSGGVRLYAAKDTGITAPQTKAASDQGGEQLMRISCPKCGEVFQANVQKSYVFCPSCNKKIDLKG